MVLARRIWGPLKTTDTQHGSLTPQQHRLVHKSAKQTVKSILNSSKGRILHAPSSWNKISRHHMSWTELEIISTITSMRLKNYSENTWTHSNNILSQLKEEPYQMKVGKGVRSTRLQSMPATFIITRFPCSLWTVLITLTNSFNRRLIKVLGNWRRPLYLLMICLHVTAQFKTFNHYSQTIS